MDRSVRWTLQANPKTSLVLLKKKEGSRPPEFVISQINKERNNTQVKLQVWFRNNFWFNTLWCRGCRGKSIEQRQEVAPPAWASSLAMDHTSRAQRQRKDWKESPAAQLLENTELHRSRHRFGTHLLCLLIVLSSLLSILKCSLKLLQVKLLALDLILQTFPSGHSAFLS